MNTESFSRFDAADYLNTDDDVAAYLDAAIREADDGAVAVALATVARAATGPVAPQAQG